MATKTTNLGLSKAELTDAVRSTLIANNENFDKIDEAYTQLKQENEEESQAIAENAEQIDTLQGQIDRLRANQIQGSASGTEVVVQDAAEMESVLQLSGNSEQDSRSGKNLLKNTAITQTINGITFTINEDKTITAKGTATANINLSITKDCNLAIGKKYALRGTGYVQPHSDIIIQSLDYQEYYVTFADKVTFTPQNNTVFEVVLRIFKDANVDMIVYPQIEEGTELTDYEPYGVQPSPDYPSEIRSVTELGQNLLKLKSGTETADGVTFTYNEDGSVTLSGTAEQGNHLYLLADLTNAPIVFKGGSYYTQSITVVSGSFDGINFTTFAKGKTNLQAMNNNQTRTFGEDCTVIRTGITFVEGTVLDCTFFVQIERGDKATTWKPYGYVPVEVKVEGKNKFNINGDVNTKYDGTTSNVNTVSGNDLTTTHNWGAGHGYGQRIYVGKGNTITFSAKLKSVVDKGYTGSSTVAQLSCYNENSINDRINLEFALKDVSNIKSLQFTAKTDYIYLTFGAYTTERVSSATFTDIQLERGSTATPYVPYIEPTTVQLPLGDIQLRSTPDGTRDTFERVDGVWNKVENVGEYVFNGTEYLHQDKELENSFRYYTNALINTLTVDKKALCSHFTQATTIDEINKTDKEKFAIFNNGQIVLRINKTIATTTEEVQSYLATQYNNGTPVTIDYQLATPTYTPITDQALISALDQLEQLILHKGYNYITATSVNGVKAQLDLTYIKDINTVLNNLTAMIATIGGELNV